jgi:hypothetical protein
MHRELPKPVKRILRELADRAHEIALRKALTDLSHDFDAWRRAEIDSFELAHRIHEFHQGADRQIHLRYTRSVDLPFLVVQSVREGLIDLADVPAEALPHLEQIFDLYRDLDRRNEAPAGDQGS